MRLSLRQRLLALTAIALMPAIAVLAFNELSLRRARETEIHDLALHYGRQANSEIAQIIGGIEAVMVAVAAMPAVTDGEPEACHAYLRKVREQVPGLNNIGMIGLDGKIICDSERARSSIDLSDRPFFRDAVATRRFVIGEFTRSRLTGQNVLPLARPILDPSGALAGVLGAGVKLDWFGEQLRRRGVSPSGSLTVADRNGVIIARDPLPERFIGTRIPDAFLQLVTAGAPGTLEVTSQDGNQRIIGYYPATLSPIGLYVSAGISKTDAFGPINRASLMAALLTGLGAGAAFALAWLSGDHFIRRPIGRLLACLDAWQGGDSKARTGFKSEGGEIESVGAALDALMDELALREQARARAEEKRELMAREMSHRLKNTLAVVQALAGQTFTGTGVPQERRRAFQERLAALARAYDTLLGGDRPAAQLRGVIGDAIRPYDGEGRFRLSGPDFELAPAAVLALTMAVHELCTNAVKYGSLSVSEGSVDLAWEESGTGVDRRLVLRWTERGGPPVSEPTARGFGTRLLHGAFAADLDPRIVLRFDREGLVCVIDLRLAPMLAEAEPDAAAEPVAARVA